MTNNPMKKVRQTTFRLKLHFQKRFRVRVKVRNEHIVISPTKGEELERRCYVLYYGSTKQSFILGF